MTTQNLGENRPEASQTAEGEVVSSGVLELQAVSLWLKYQEGDIDGEEVEEIPEEAIWLCKIELDTLSYELYYAPSEQAYYIQFGDLDMDRTEIYGEKIWLGAGIVKLKSEVKP